MVLIRIVLFFLFPYTVLWGDDNLIRELESLRSTIKRQDKSRPVLTRRLADVYFDAAIVMDKDNILKGIVVPTPKLRKYRRKAISLYTEALNGDSGFHPSASGELKINIEYQLARLYFASGKKKKAVRFYKKILSNKDSPSNLLRESALQMAEYYEALGSFNKSHDYYRQALALCAGDVCSYTQYRLAWLLYRNEMYPKAVEEGRAALWGTQGVVKEYALKDFIVFLSNMPGDGQKELDEVDELAKKLKRPSLIRQLAEGFYAVGNQEAGANVLSIVNDRSPKLYFQMRLAESYYGMRRWGDLQTMLDQIRDSHSPAFDNKEEKTEINKILKRLIVQLDGEQYGKKEKAKKPLQESIFIYLALYPLDLEMRKKLMDGWLSVEDDNSKKADQLAVWIEEEKKSKRTSEEIRLRKLRLSAAQEMKNLDMTIEEAEILSSVLPDKKEARHHFYLAARIYYKEKNYKKALDMFRQLARQGSDASEGERPDRWAVLSQNLVLDILNTQKRFKDILQQVDGWTKNPVLQNDPSLKKELTEMEKIYNQAEFAWAVSRKDSPEALAVFEKNCFSGKFEKKSCDNAKVLAIKLRRQKKLVKILEKLKDEKALAAEYELMGRFSESASLLEKRELKKNSPIPLYLRIALLYELDQNVKDRNRILKRLMTRLKKEKELDPALEGLVYNTLVDGGFWGSKLFFLPWNQNYRNKLVRELEAAGLGTKQTRKILISSKTSMGPAWTRFVLKRLLVLDKKQKKIRFYGRNSKRKLQKRLDAIAALAIEAKKFLPGADTSTRIYIANLLSESYGGLALEIESTPIPKVIEDQTQIARIRQNLRQMADPFIKEKSAYDKIKEEQLKLDVSVNQKRIVDNLGSSPEEFAALLKKKRNMKPGVETLNMVEIQNQLQILQEDPFNKDAITVIHQYYVKNDRPRLAAYFKGRLKK